jgi:SNF2 family DNA or RNA helicase
MTTYRLIRNDIVLHCDTPEACAVAELIRMRDKDGKHHSDWWGHPEFSTTPEGLTRVAIPCNVHNLSVIHECGVRPDKTDDGTLGRIAFFLASKKQFETTFPLMNFQRDGAEWLVRGDLRRILAYTMGLGKTITTMSALMSDPERYLPAVIMAPAHVKLNWADEWTKWGGSADEVVVLFGRTPNADLLIGKKLIVLNHHILNGWLDTLIASTPKTMVIDEAHNFVNSKTKTYPMADRLARACSRRVLLLTATPLVNDLNDLWGLCNLISPDILGLKKVFEATFMPEEKVKAAMFASRWRGGFSNINWRTVAMARLPKDIQAKRIDELGSILRKLVILRKNKTDVYTELPDITETHLRLDIPRTTPEGVAFWTVEDECDAKMTEAKEDVLASNSMLTAFAVARQNAARAKMQDAIAWISNFLSDSDSTEKLIVVGWSVAPLEELHKHFKKQSLLINGSVDAKKKKERERAFDTNAEKRILFGNVKSIGTGINLVAARTMLFLELPLTAVEFEQVKGRIDRLSQTSKALSYYYMTIRNSIEERMIWKIIRKKQEITADLGLQ